jgi:hypothetical protein
MIAGSRGWPSCGGNSRRTGRRAVKPGLDAPWGP